MNKHRYSTFDRVIQLKALKAALVVLVEYLHKNSLFPNEMCNYQAAIRNIEILIASGFTQKDLSSLSRNVPDLFTRHKEWVPPLEGDLEQGYGEAQWYQSLDKRLQPALSCAGVLSTIGYY